MESVITFTIFLFLVAVIAVPYWVRAARRKRTARESHLRASKAGLTDPATLHPRIDITDCIGCASCVRACPEHVLGIVGGVAAVIHGTRCVSHELCVEACPVGAITMGFGRPRAGMEIPLYDEHYQSNVPGLYLAGEVGGIGLIRNAFNQAMASIDHIASVRPAQRNGALDVLIVGAGPAGFAAALSAKYRNLSFGVVEQDSLGGSILHYPRKKLVLTTPVELPLYGKFEGPEISKEELLDIFVSSVRRFGIPVRQHEKVKAIESSGGIFRVTTDRASFESRSVILAIGRRGSPRKLGVKGEDLPKIYYRLIEAETYTENNLLVVGGGDSAVEAAVALARQKGNTVTLSYRREDFVRLKEKNDKNIRSMMSSGRVRVEFSSEVTVITPDAVTLKTSAGFESTVANDAVFIFAGGELPAEFLKKVGIALRTEEKSSVG
ncbi:MAG TPA: NAD(P)-binding domain-containing protein [Bacteroidota bacterium]|nr:NAD(P)-binding domain-containing protein [Bacteroidota bacterium]